jgi:hypothetical protein
MDVPHKNLCKPSNLLSAAILLSLCLVTDALANAGTPLRWGGFRLPFFFILRVNNSYRICCRYLCAIF